MHFRPLSTTFSCLIKTPASSKSILLSMPKGDAKGSEKDLPGPFYSKLNSKISNQFIVSVPGQNQHVQQSLSNFKNRSFIASLLMISKLR
jgi:hypothetical protein